MAVAEGRHVVNSENFEDIFEYLDQDEELENELLELSNDVSIHLYFF